MFGMRKISGPRLAGALLVIILGSTATWAQEDDDKDVTDPEIIYLQENARKEGIFIRPSGLQIRIITRGDGDIPEPASSVVVQYEGRLIDGTVFDSSYQRGVPATFAINGVIKGWTEALIMMQVGSVWEIVMPASIGYGDDGAGETIPPGATLIFKVELLAIQ